MDPSPTSPPPVGKPPVDQPDGSTEPDEGDGCLERPVEADLLVEEISIDGMCGVY